VPVHDGTAEAIPLGDGSVDVVTVAQAFHWFDPVAAMAEIRRVLAPDGGLAVLFNERDERRPWVARLSGVLDWHRHRVAQYHATDWSAVIGAEGEAAFDWEQSMTRRDLAARVRSISYVALMAPDEQSELVQRAVALVEGMAEPFAMPYVTRVWWGRPGP
jgi:SAM-dependent methyltransferase